MPGSGGGPPGVTIPRRLDAACRTLAGGTAWLERLPDLIRTALDRWRLTIDGPPFDHDGASWVAPVATADRGRAVLKIGVPHLEAEDEIAGLRFWDGDAMVRLLDADERAHAMLLERCRPGLPLRALGPADQDAVIASTLRRLWRAPPPGAFRPLATMTAHWSAGSRAARGAWPDAALVEDGLRLLEELARPSADDVLLATDLHAGNVLSAEREPWLAIDPKPFVGDRAYDATQHLLNGLDRLRRHPARTIERFAARLDVDAERVRLWTFARLAVEHDQWRGAHALARRLGGAGRPAPARGARRARP